MLSRIATLTALAVLLPGLGNAEGVQPSLRKLCIDAPTVVLAEPIDPVTPTRFKVVLVVRGKNVKARQTLAPAGLSALDVKTYDEKDPETGKWRPRIISQAMLFLTAGDEPRLLSGGLRMCTDDGRVLVPAAEKRSTEKPAPLEVQPRLSWPALIDRVRSDVVSVDQLQTYRRISRPQRRTQALLDWVRRRRGEFAAAPTQAMTDDAPAGWEDLQLAVFDWALEGAGPEDAWTVVKLYAELNRGELPALRRPLFSIPSGRTLLAKIARDGQSVNAERRRALRLLCERITLWPVEEECRQGATTMDAKEQESLLDNVASLLSTPDQELRAAVVQTITRLSLPDGKDALARRTARCLPALLAAYRAASPGPVRDELSTAICSLSPPSQWKELTGNPPGVCVCLRDLERDGVTVTFWLTRPAGAATFEQPVLILDKMGALGFVSESKRLPLQVLNLAGGWASGWKGTTALAVRMDLPGLTPGSTYRLRVEGFIDKGKARQKWISEPKRFLYPAPIQPGNPRAYRRGMISN